MPARTGFPGTTTDGDVLLSADIDKLPGGLIGYASRATTLGSVTVATDIIGSLTVTTANNRIYRVSAYCPWVQQTAGSAGAFCDVLITNASNVTLQRWIIGGTGLSAPLSGAHLATVFSATGASSSFKLRLAPNSGTWHSVNTSTYKSWLMVEDVGPSF